jgi:hypothetical protein
MRGLMPASGTDSHFYMGQALVAGCSFGKHSTSASRRIQVESCMPGNVPFFFPDNEQGIQLVSLGQPVIGKRFEKLGQPF